MIVPIYRRINPVNCSEEFTERLIWTADLRQHLVLLGISSLNFIRIVFARYHVRFVVIVPLSKVKRRTNRWFGLIARHKLARSSGFRLTRQTKFDNNNLLRDAKMADMELPSIKRNWISNWENQTCQVQKLQSVLYCVTRLGRYV